MKSKLIVLMLITICLTFLVMPVEKVQAAEIEGMTQYGVMTTDGGTSHRGIVVGGEIVLVNISDGVKIKERIAKFHGRGVDFQGEFALTILEAIVWRSFLNLYVNGKKGFFFEDRQGDDRTWAVFGVGIGCYPIKDKFQLEFGVDVMPTDDRGDKAWVYASMNIIFGK